MNHEEKRPRRLLLKKKEIMRLETQMAEKGMTLVPTKMYFSKQWIKVEIGVGRGKKLHDKRDSAKTRDANREMQRALRRG
jgi:SsrA-binding protein